MTTNKERKEKILKKIQHLLSKTIENGCTEAEAISASEKVSELLNEYDISMTELDAKEENFIQDEKVVESGVKKPIHNLVFAISYLTDTKSWFSKQGKSFKYYFFGMDKDVQAAHFLFDMLSSSMDSEYLKFKKTPEYKMVNGNTARVSFYTGITARLHQRLVQMKDTTKVSNQEQGVVLYNKMAIVETKFKEQFNLRLGKERRSKSSNINMGAYMAGRKAADNVNITTGITTKRKCLTA